MNIKCALFLVTIGIAGFANASNLIANGGFDSGLSNWQTFTTSNGTIGTPDTASFDTTGYGSNPAAVFNVGKVLFSWDALSIYEGGGVSQSFSVLSDGVYRVSADVAAYSRDIYLNASGGRFNIFVDNLKLATWDSGELAAHQTKRSSIFDNVALAAGGHTLSILLERPYTNGGSTPLQYIDNVSVAAVPEPETYAMMLAGIGLLGLTARRRNQKLSA